MNKTLLKDNSKTNRPASLLSVSNDRKFKKIFITSCLLSLVISLLAIYIETQNTLHKSCESVATGFTSIMQSYKHSFCLFEILVQQQIASAENADEIETFLKKQDEPLLAIEGSDYDGIYMYYQNRYLYSWDTPFAVYRDSGYDATSRPWYIGAVAAGGEIFFSVPYPSYANDYMLATISRLQPDGETVIAYDIKLGEIGKYVDKLDIFNGSLTLICDADGNIIGSTDHLYQGGNYLLSANELQANIQLAQQELKDSTDEKAKTKAVQKVQSAEAQKEFCTSESKYLTKLLHNEKTLQFKLQNMSTGYAYSNGKYICFVLAPLVKLLPRLAVLWAALSFLFILAAILVTNIVGRSNQILVDVLTGLNNRRALSKYCNNHILHRPSENLCLIMLDLNNFKQINDKFGHMAGDHALLDTADALKKTCAEAPCDFFLCRYGGDEFLLAGHNCSAAAVEQTKKLINNNLSLKNQSGNNPYVLEASMGVASGPCIDTAAFDNLLMLADKAMYAEKVRMKNKTAGSGS